MARHEVHGMGIEYETVYRDVKYPRLEFKTGELLLILPKNYRNHGELIEKHKNWILERYSFIEDALRESENKKLLERTEEAFRDLVYSFVEDISRELKLNINKVYFRRMKSKWGSCSSKRNLTVNTLLKYLPENLIKYVIFHEIVHLIERKHNEQFWKIISQRFNDYPQKERDLLVYWFLIQRVVRYDGELPLSWLNPHFR